MRNPTAALLAALSALAVGCVIKETEIVREVCCDACAPADDASTDTHLPDTQAPEDTHVEEASADAIDDTIDDVIDASDACAPPTSEWHVSPSGSDVDGNGSLGCPFKTITKAIAAVDAADVGATITVHHEGAPSIYGDGCTGGAPCDATPIVMPSSVAHPLVIRGDGATAEIEVTGGGASVFLVHGAQVSFEAMTVKPTKTGTAGSGGHGLVYDVATTALPYLRDVTVTGPTATDAVAGMGSAVLLKNQSRLRAEHGIELRGGYHALRVEDRAFGLFNGTIAKKVIARESGAACVSVAGTSPTATAGFNVDAIGDGGAVIQDCGPEGGIVLSNALSNTYGLFIGRTGAKVFPGVRARAGSSGVVTAEIRALGADGVVIEDGGSLTVEGRVTSNAGAGVRILSGGSGRAKAEIRGNAGDGVHCEAGGTLGDLGHSVITGNGGSGVVLAATCTATLGIDVTFNKTSEKNAGAGLCLLGPNTVSTSSSSFSCGYTGAACGAGTPTRATSATCAAGVDISAPAGASVTHPSHQCCP